MSTQLSLLSPKRMDISDPYYCLTLSNENTHVNSLGLELPLNTEIVSICEIKNGETPQVNIPLHEIMNTELIERLQMLKGSVGQCSNMAEKLFGKLKDLVKALEHNSAVKDILLKYPKGDFMSHRNIFSDIIKSKCIRCVNTVMAVYDSKSVRRALNNFILDRNKYVHGKILYWTEKQIYLISYEDDVSKQVVYAEMEIQILKSFIECYNELSKLFSDINDCLRKI
ncbi:MAG: hypothetical protein IPJ31_15035 [Bacteroidetes bacterium]|nr:hypothetical protein [Bacteroidota bacterium]